MQQWSGLGKVHDFMDRCAPVWIGKKKLVYGCGSAKKNLCTGVDRQKKFVYGCGSAKKIVYGCGSAANRGLVRQLKGGGGL